MLIANEAVAEHFTRQNCSSADHEIQKQEKVQKFIDYASSFGIKSARNG